MDLSSQPTNNAKEAALKVEAAKPPEFSRVSIEKMDAPTVRKLLEERGLPTSGKIERLRERLSQVKANDRVLPALADIAREISELQVHILPFNLSFD